jgi:hypothetical protein
VIEHDVAHRFLPAQKPAAMQSILQAASSPVVSKNLWLLHLKPCSSRKTHRIILPGAAAIPAISQCSPPQHLLLASPTPLPTVAHPAALPTVQHVQEFPFSSVWQVIKHAAARRLTSSSTQKPAAIQIPTTGSFKLRCQQRCVVSHLEPHGSEKKTHRFIIPCAVATTGHPPPSPRRGLTPQFITLFLADAPTDHNLPPPDKISTSVTVLTLPRLADPLSPLRYPRPGSPPPSGHSNPSNIAGLPLPHSSHRTSYHTPRFTTRRTARLSRIDST